VISAPTIVRISRLLHFAIAASALSPSSADGFITPIDISELQGIISPTSHIIFPVYRSLWRRERALP
jgi:hypothetical protein